ncbi:MAG: hypothetical protein BWZ10_03495 [candidate division BRC1 bacterium ADurb.BinA364]|nr:MAG: hypothetical protein BWZ10_03495 [candidate division BRC1 bacterium ADurb.BinA364]
MRRRQLRHARGLRRRAPQSDLRPARWSFLRTRGLRDVGRHRAACLAPRRSALRRIRRRGGAGPGRHADRQALSAGGMLCRRLGHHRNALPNRQRHWAGRGAAHRRRRGRSRPYARVHRRPGPGWRRDRLRRKRQPSLSGSGKIDEGLSRRPPDGDDRRRRRRQVRLHRLADQRRCPPRFAHRPRLP